MSPGDIASIVSAAVAVAAAAGSLFGYLRARAEKAEAAEQAAIATRAAVDAADAERRSADAAERSAAALEEQNTLASAQTSAGEESPWRFEHVRGMRWRLCNRLAKRAYGVQLHHANQSMFKGATTQQQVDGRGSFEFMLINGAGEQVTVTWHRQPELTDAEQQWTDVLPRY
ncbi:hypothetical protein ACTWP6_05570 [Mycobacterium sp. 4D054]|uniref:hypothetical protein n=1 Tax=Mycobacterium sp. 4D054 TaxID=3457440 RepID=UPI003FD15BF5